MTAGAVSKKPLRAVFSIARSRGTSRIVANFAKLFTLVAITDEVIEY